MELEKDYADEDNDVVYVNIWNTDNNGDLKLTHQKPMLKETFEKMEKARNFSLFSNNNLLQSPSIKSDDYRTNVFAPVTVRPVGGVGDGNQLEQAKPSQNMFQNADAKNSFFPFLSSAQVRISDLFLEI